VSQWLKGRIYERRSDLSPDGAHLIYFAMNGRRQSETKGSWTAISRSPWLKAIALFGKGDCWHGGGLFTSNRTYWLNDGYGHEVLFDTKEVRRDPTYKPQQCFGGECLGVYYPRLVREGWELVERQERGKWHGLSIFTKGLPKGWTLKKIAHEQVGSPKGKSCYWDEHELTDKHGDARRFPTWEWADWDDGRLVWAEDGCLYAARVTDSRRLGRPTLLYDFNDLRFQALTAPY